MATDLRAYHAPIALSEIQGRKSATFDRRAALFLLPNRDANDDDSTVGSLSAAGQRSARLFRKLKIAFDVITGGVLLVLLAPLMAMVMVLVKLTSRGPALYAQTRVGLGERTFQIYKIRTMVDKCEKETGPAWSTARDPRVTPVGRFLRRTHLDELPQLWNVVRGDMSLVGPRPERPEFVSQLALEIPRYRERLTIKPGVTGFAQIQLPPDTSLLSVRQKLSYDLYYVEQVSFWLDVKILAGTALKLACVPAWGIRRLVGLPGWDNVIGGTGSTQSPRTAFADH